MKSARRGFTVTELLIVIVVIAILAAIIVVTYRGLLQRANENLISDTVGKVNKQLELIKIANGAYPPNLDNIAKNSNVHYQYSVSADGQSYCMTGMHVSARDTAHFVDQSGKVRKGACAGHQSNLAGDGGEQGESGAMVAQRAGRCCGSGQQTVTLSQAPTAGNLIVAVVGWRTDTVTTASISGSGWQTAVSAFDNSLDKYGVRVFWKIASNNEPTSITATTSGASSSNNLLVQEFTLANTTVGTPSARSTTNWWWDYGSSGSVSVSSDRSLAIGFSVNYRGTHRLDSGGITWSSGFQDEYNTDDSSNISISTVWQLYEQPGSYNAVATWGDTSGSASTDQATVGLVVFPFQ